MNQRLKVLVCAYACSPVRGSEPGMGWQWVEAMSRYHDLWVLTEKDEFQAEVEAELARRPELAERVRFFFIRKHRHRTLRKIWPPSFYWFYGRWHREAYKLAKRLHAEVGFDVVHQLNMIGFREPGYLWKLDAPFVWGPVGGTSNVPLRFASVLGAGGFLFHLCRSALNAWHLRFRRRVKAALGRADALITATSHARDAFLRVWGRDSVVIHDAGSAPLTDGDPPPRRGLADRPLRLVFSGLHVTRKALPVVLEALAALSSGCCWHLDVLGSGPMTRSWRRRAARLGLEGRCMWHGWVAKADAVRIVSQADLLVFPSLNEGTPHAVLEALATGVPVLCFDHCGQGDVVTPDCGVKVPVTTPARAARDFARAIQDLAGRPAERERLSRGAAARSRELTWASMAEAMCRVYEQAIERHRVNL